MLCNKEWFNTFSDSFVIVKNKEMMNHCPLLCTVPMQLEKIHKSFKFFNYMKDIEGFLPIVYRVWANQWYGILWPFSGG